MGAYDNVLMIPAIIVGVIFACGILLIGTGFKLATSISATKGVKNDAGNMIKWGFMLAVPSGIILGIGALLMPKNSTPVKNNSVVIPNEAPVR